MASWVHMRWLAAPSPSPIWACTMWTTSPLSSTLPRYPALHFCLYSTCCRLLLLLFLPYTSCHVLCGWSTLVTISVYVIAAGSSPLCSRHLLPCLLPPASRPFSLPPASALVLCYQLLALLLFPPFGNLYSLSEHLPYCSGCLSVVYV